MNSGPRLGHHSAEVCDARISDHGRLAPISENWVDEDPGPLGLSRADLPQAAPVQACP